REYNFGNKAPNFEFIEDERLLMTTSYQGMSLISVSDGSVLKKFQSNTSEVLDMGCDTTSDQLVLYHGDRSTSWNRSMHRVARTLDKGQQGFDDSFRKLFTGFPSNDSDHKKAVLASLSPELSDIF